MDESMSVEKKEDDHEEPHHDLEEDLGSDTPGAEGHPPQQGELAPPVKRKGGRKPIYNTSEERKQRNRQAQAAFRERRTEYIKELEVALHELRTNYHNVQTAHVNATDEVLMLRYKNSLLERILLERGIDVQTELMMKDSPSLGGVHAAPSMVPPPNARRAMMNRHQQARRSASFIAPKATSMPLSGQPSPQAGPTPVSQHSSPAGNSPAYAAGQAMTPPGSDTRASQQRMMQPLKPHMPHGLANLPGGIVQQQMAPSQKSPAESGAGMLSSGTGGYYQPPFQSPNYNLQTDGRQGSDVGDIPVGNQYQTQNLAPRPQMQPQTQQQQFNAATQAGVDTPQHGQFGTMGNMYPFDQPMDADPFGLSSSMK